MWVYFKHNYLGHVYLLMQWSKSVRKLQNKKIPRKHECTLSRLVEQNGTFLIRGFQ